VFPAKRLRKTNEEDIEIIESTLRNYRKLTEEYLKNERMIMRNIQIEELGATPITERKVESGWKGKGWASDYICDSIMNQVSVELCREYIERFGAIMHHNIDKGMLVAGEVKTKFGGGVILKPCVLYLGTGRPLKLKGISLM